MITGTNDLGTAVEVTKCGTQDYITKPFDPRNTALRVHRTVEPWADREWSARPFEFPAMPDAEWLRVTPKREGDADLMRFSDMAPGR
jgi:DNA-binding response OmpR family regulator